MKSGNHAKAIVAFASQKQMWSYEATPARLSAPLGRNHEWLFMNGYSSQAHNSVYLDSPAAVRGNQGCVSKKRAQMGNCHLKHSKSQVTKKLKRDTRFVRFPSAPLCPPSLMLPLGIVFIVSHLETSAADTTIWKGCRFWLEKKLK